MFALLSNQFLASRQISNGEYQTADLLIYFKSLALSGGFLVTCYYALEHCCCATHNSHCKDPDVTVLFCFQGGPGTGDCQGQHLLLARAQQCHSPALVGRGSAKPEEKNTF